MSKRKHRQQQERGTYALCITFATFIGFGLGALMEAILIMSALGAAVGIAAAYWLNHRRGKRR